MFIIDIAWESVSDIFTFYPRIYSIDIYLFFIDYFHN